MQGMVHLRAGCIHLGVLFCAQMHGDASLLTTETDSYALVAYEVGKESTSMNKNCAGNRPSVTYSNRPNCFKL